MRKTERWTSKKTFLYSIEKLRIKTRHILSKIHSENIETYNLIGKKYNIEFSCDEFGRTIPKLIINSNKSFLIKSVGNVTAFEIKNYIFEFAFFALFCGIVPSLICLANITNIDFLIISCFVYLFSILFYYGFQFSLYEKFESSQFGFFNGSDWEYITNNKEATKKELLQLETFLELIVKIDKDVKNSMNNLFFSTVNSVKLIETDKVGALSLKE